MLALAYKAVTPSFPNDSARLMFTSDWTENSQHASEY